MSTAKRCVAFCSAKTLILNETPRIEDACIKAEDVFIAMELPEGSDEGSTFSYGDVANIACGPGAAYS